MAVPDAASRTPTSLRTSELTSAQSTWRLIAAPAPAWWSSSWSTTSSPTPSSWTSTSAVWRDSRPPKRWLGGRRIVARRVCVPRGHLLGPCRRPWPPAVHASCATQRRAGPARSSSCPSGIRSSVQTGGVCGLRVVALPGGRSVETHAPRGRQPPDRRLGEGIHSGAAMLAMSSRSTIMQSRRTQADGARTARFGSARVASTIARRPAASMKVTPDRSKTRMDRWLASRRARRGAVTASRSPITRSRRAWFLHLGRCGPTRFDRPHRIM